VVFKVIFPVLKKQKRIKLNKLIWERQHSLSPSLPPTPHIRRRRRRRISKEGI